MTGPTAWDKPGDFIDDPEGDRPILVESPIAAERRGGVSLDKQAELDRRRP